MSSSHGIVAPSPSLGACYRWAASFVLWLSVTGVVITIISRKVRHQALPQSWFDHPMQLPAVLIGVTSAFGMFLFVVAWAFAPSITAEGLKGPWSWGQATTLPWSSIDAVEVANIQGVPGVLVKSTTLQKKIFMLTVGIDLRALHQALACTAGQSHVLTEYFKPHDA